MPANLCGEFGKILFAGKPAPKSILLLDRIFSLPRAGGLYIWHVAIIKEPGINHVAIERFQLDYLTGPVLVK